MNFLDLGLSEKTIQAVDEYGVCEPTTVQADVIPSILQGKDIFTIAPRGCGKTMSYVLPLVDIISKKEKQNILIITPSSRQSVVVSDRLAVFNKYHEIVDATVTSLEEDIDNEANVIIGSPDLLVELVVEGKVDLSNINILVVDDINLIKTNKQLENLEKILEMLPQDKQNIVYTNRRSKDTQDILDKILKSPQEIKVDKTKEAEAEELVQTNQCDFEPKGKRAPRQENERINPYKVSPAQKDDYALDLIKKYKSFNGKVPEFLTHKGVIVDID